MEEELRGEFEGFIGSNLEVEDNGEWMRGNGGGEGHLIIPSPIGQRLATFFNCRQNGGNNGDPPKRRHSLKMAFLKG
jgi:hypothetical protein